jgi:hypothetical protein
MWVEYIPYEYYISVQYLYSNDAVTKGGCVVSGGGDDFGICESHFVFDGEILAVHDEFIHLP